MPIQSHSLLNQYESGIRFEGRLPGQIAYYDQVNACINAGYKFFHDWQELTSEQRAFLIAFYLVQKYVSVHGQDAEARAMKRKQKG